MDATTSYNNLATGGQDLRNLKNANSYYRNCYGIYINALGGKTFHGKRMPPNLSAQKQTHQVGILHFHAFLVRARRNGSLITWL